jgi:DNA repair exonuclease SbcCD nuclease subunit
MKLAVIADVHLASHRRFGGEGPVNNRATDILSALHSIRPRLLERGVHMLAVAGDFYDTDKPPPQLIAEVQSWLDSMKPLEVTFIAGNHDRRSNVGGDHALAPLYGRARIFDCPGSLGNVLYVPFRTAPRGWWAEDVLQFEPDGSRDYAVAVIVTHIGVEFGDTPFFLQGKDDSLPVDAIGHTALQLGAHTVVCGNYHKPCVQMSASGVNVIQCGTFTPAGWDDPGLDYGHVVIVDTEMSGWFEVVKIPGPRFIHGNTQDWRDVRESGPRQCVVYVRVPVGPHESLPGEYLREERMGTVTLDRVVDTELRKLNAQAAVASARDEASFREALTAFLAKTEVPEGTSREAVEARVLRYMRGVTS